MVLEDRAVIRRGGEFPFYSFKPNLFRYGKSVATKACHAFASTTQVGLIQALGCSIEFLQGTYANDRKAHLQIVANCIGSGVHGRLVGSGLTF